MVVGKTVTVTVLVVGIYFRAIGRSKNPGEPVVMWWAKSASLVEVRLTNLSKSTSYRPAST